MEHYKDIKDVHETLVGAYISKRFKHFCFSYGWDSHLAQLVTGISIKRSNNRIKNYVIEDELERVEDRVREGKDFSLRFGVEKRGSGNFGMRGDFCLLGASYSKKVLTLHYRSLELFGGLVYDQAILGYVISWLGIEVKKIVCMCSSCHTFALKKNSNEKLWEQLQQIYSEYE